MVPDGPDVPSLQIASGAHRWKSYSSSGGAGSSKGGRALALFRSRFAEDELAGAARQGVRQYVVLGAGLDTFAYRQPSYADTLQIRSGPDTSAGCRARA
jgi:O-methyltransferase involved in polyketide biosynthesis